MFNPIYHELQEVLLPSSELTIENARVLAAKLHEIANELDTVCAKICQDAGDLEGQCVHGTVQQENDGNGHVTERIASGNNAGTSGEAP